MSTLLESFGEIATELGTHLQLISSMGPADAMSHIKTEGLAIENAVESALEDHIDHGDLVAPHYLTNWRSYWHEMPTDFSVESQLEAKRILYICAKQAQAAHDVLYYISVEDTASPIVPVFLKNGGITDIGTTQKPGDLLSIMAGFAEKCLHMHPDTIDRNALARQLLRLKPMMVVKPETKKMKEEVIGFFAGLVTDHAKLSGQLSGESLGDVEVAVNKSSLRIRQQTVELFAWKDSHHEATVDIAMLQHLFDDRGIDTFSIDKLNERIPRI